MEIRRSGSQPSTKGRLIGFQVQSETPLPEIPQFSCLSAGAQPNLRFAVKTLVPNHSATCAVSGTKPYGLVG